MQCYDDDYMVNYANVEGESFGGYEFKFDVSSTLTIYICTFSMATCFLSHVLN